MIEAYLITQTRQVRIEAVSAAEARQQAELYFNLDAKKKFVVDTINVEKVRD